MFESKWDDKEVVDLFKEVERIKDENKSLKEAFSAHATKYKRRPNSVRNYYYHEVDDLLKNKVRLKKLGIDMSKHKKQEVKFFSEKEGEKIVEAIDKLVKEGNSVRQACLKLSGGNVALMLRYQNKYRNNAAKKTEAAPKPINILEYRNKQKSLSDFDINSLFNGLVKLVKKMAYEEACVNLRKERDSISFLLKKSLIDLNKREKEIAVLKEEYNQLFAQNKVLSEKLSNLKLEKAKALTKKFGELKRTSSQSTNQL